MRWIQAGLIVGALAAWPMVSGAAEHGGKEHGGTAQTQAPSQQPAAATQEHGGGTQEHGGTAQSTPAAPVEPSPEQIRQTIRDYVAAVEQEEGSFTIEDDVTGTVRTLELVRVHDRVGKTGAYYYACTDMNGPGPGELVDLDFDVEQEDGDLNVVDVRIHKVNGEARYTYDDQDNRIPLM